MFIGGAAYQTYNNTITQNQCTSTSTSARGGGLYVSSGTVSSVNNIVWENIAVLDANIYGALGCSYSDVSPLLAGMGNIAADPVFWDRDNDDFHLMAISPCIDAGHPSTPLDPDSTTADMGALFFDQSTGAMFVPYMVTNLIVTHNNAALTATIAWTNPTVCANQQPLTELFGVHIYRNGDFVADVTTVVIGQPSTYNDSTVPVPGMYEYELVPYNSHGDGVPEQGGAWIGIDTPGYPGIITATPDPNFNLICTLDWSAPTIGEHGGYFPAGSWDGQKIYRNDVLLTTLAGTNVTFEDNTIPSEGFYTYGVSYYNTAGEGPMGMTFPVYIGEPEYVAIPYDWFEITTVGVNTGIVNDDQTIGPFDIGFAFPWWDFNYASQVWICSNGWLAFSTGQGTAYNNGAIPNAIAPNNVVYPYWDDLTPGGVGQVWYYQDAANDRFIVEWYNMPHFSTGGTYTFQAILYENGDIDFQYQTLTPGTNNEATVGIEDAAGIQAVQATYNGSGPLNPLPQMGIRIYTVNAGAPDLTVDLTPSVTPVQIPAGGGNFQYTINIANVGTTPATFDAWIDITMPTGSLYPVLQRTGLTVAPGGSIVRNLTQNVPAVAPSGNYSCNAHAGAYPSVIFAEDSFPFTKLAAGDEFTNPDNTWNLYGWDGEIVSQLPTVYDLLPAYPNPFNPETNLVYTLPAGGYVELVLFDIQGREVAKLVNGWQAAGEYNVIFNASNCASGVYFAMLKAGGKQFTQKLLLVK